MRIWRELERRVFQLLNTSTSYPVQMRHKTPRGFWVGGIPADALLYDQNVLDWTMVGELIGDREYIGRGFVPSTRTLTDWEKRFIQWTFEPAKTPSPMGVIGPGIYDSEYTLRYVAYGDQDATRADEATAKVRAEASKTAGNERPKEWGCTSCEQHKTDMGRGQIERMVKVPPWLFSAEADVYKNPKMLKR